MERLHVFFNIYFRLFIFFYFLYLLQTLQYILTYLDSTENILILFCHSFYIHKKKINLYTLISFYLLTWIQIIQYKNIHTLLNHIETSLFPMNFLISFVICSTPKRSRNVIFSTFIPAYPISSYWFRLIKIDYICHILYFR